MAEHSTKMDQSVCTKARTPHDDSVAHGMSSRPQFTEWRCWHQRSL